MTSGRLIANQIKVRLLGVCDQPDRELEERVDLECDEVVGDAGLVGELWFADEVRVERRVGESVGVSSKGLGWFRVATILALSPQLRDPVDR